MPLASYFFYAILFVLGLAAGSFLNVLSLRYDPNRSVFAPENVGGRSNCPHCKKELAWFELVPVLSFLIQKGACRSCGSRLSLQYPLVEFLGGLIFLFTPLYLNSFYGVSRASFSFFEAPRWYYGIVLIWILALLILLLIAVIDLRRFLIPDELNIALGILAIVLVIISVSLNETLPLFRDSFLRHYSLLFSLFRNPIANHALGALLGSLFFGVLVFASKGKAMGMGDVKFAFSSGLLFGSPDIFLAIVISFIVGGAIGSFLLLRKKKTMRDKLPFAPFLVLGMAATFFFGFPLVKGYFALFNL